MTGDEIIALGRAYFGEPVASSILEATADSFLNVAVQELYEDLPADRLRLLQIIDSPTFTAGKAVIPTAWDKVLGVYVDGVQAVGVSPEVIKAVDAGAYFVPIVPVFSIDNQTMWVRPTTGAITVGHIDPPAEIADTSLEITSFSVMWHPALACLLASYMYAQEEDAEQAQYYRNEYLALVTSVSSQMEAESA